MRSEQMLRHELKSAVLDTITDLNTDVRDIYDYHEFPCVLENHIKKLFHIDWLGLFVFGQRLPSYNVVTSPSMPLTWPDEKYKEFFNLDKIRTEMINADIGGTLVFTLWPFTALKLLFVIRGSACTGLMYITCFQTTKDRSWII